ncbi:MAG: hypothetical protein WC640_00725 [Candidatus Paceibacterota bacterium]|jgi:hypothetical protein
MTDDQTPSDNNADPLINSGIDDIDGEGDLLGVDPDLLEDDPVLDEDLASWN